MYQNHERPLTIQALSPKTKGVPGSNPMTGNGWDWDHQTYEKSGRDEGIRPGWCEMVDFQNAPFCVSPFGMAIADTWRTHPCIDPKNHYYKLHEVSKVNLKEHIKSSKWEKFSNITLGRVLYNPNAPSNWWYLSWLTYICPTLKPPACQIRRWRLTKGDPGFDRIMSKSLCSWCFNQVQRKTGFPTFSCHKGSSNWNYNRISKPPICPKKTTLNKQELKFQLHLI